MKKFLSFLLMTIMVSTSAFGYDWTDTSGGYPYHKVVYVKLLDGSGNVITDPVQLGAFDGDYCRGVATVDYLGNRPIYTLRIGTAENERTSAFYVVHCGVDDYALDASIVLNGADETVGSPSNPIEVTFNYPTAISFNPDSKTMLVGESFKVADVLTIEPAGAILPYPLRMSQDKEGDFIKKTTYPDPAVTAIGGGQVGFQVFMATPVAGHGNSGTPELSATLNLDIRTAITAFSISPNYPDGTITVNINDGDGLMNGLNSIIVKKPADATEDIVWVPSDKTAFQLSPVATNMWEPVKAGTFTMTATSKAAKQDVTVIVRQPVEKWAQNVQLLRVTVGANVSELLPHTFSLFPETATDPMSGIHYSIIGEDGEGNPILTMDNEGVITATAVGYATVDVTHDDLGDADLFTVSVEVVNVPAESDFSISQDPLVIEVMQDLLGQYDITDLIKGNIKTGALNFNELTWTENYGTGTPVLTINGDGKVAEYSFFAAAYGESAIQGTYTVNLSGFDENKEFHASIPTTVTTGFGITITRSLEAITFNAINIGCEDTYELEITTTPSNYPLTEIQFTIPSVVDGQDVPMFTLDRVVGSENKWTLTPKLVGSSRLTANVGNISHTEPVKISQHVSLAEGWSWLSLYSGSESAEEFAASYQNVQEMRSQSQLMYNDEKYGFFGSLTSLDNSSSYRVNVKSGLTIDYIAPNVDLYSNDIKSVTFNPGWTWFSSPYCKDHNFQEVFAKVMRLPDNSRIISHTGFMTFSEETLSWAGTLESLNAGEGYLVYNAGVNGVDVEFMPDRYLSEYVPSNNESNAFDLYSEEAEWEYNPRRFADNMSIIANFPQDLEIGRYSIGAFVNGECRGEGKMIGRRFFITVAGQAGETVDFQLFDRSTGEYTLVDSNVAFSAMEGTLANPLTLKADVTGVDFIRNDGNVNIEIIGGDIVVNGAKASDVKVYTVSGKEVGSENLSSGIYIVKVATENGVITRKVVK